MTETFEEFWEKFSKEHPYCPDPRIYPMSANFYLDWVINYRKELKQKLKDKKQITKEDNE